MRKVLIIGPLTAILCGLCIYFLSRPTPHYINIPTGTVDTLNVETININLNGPLISLDSLIEEVRYVALEEMEHSKIMGIEKIIMDDNLILVMDAEGQKVVGFDFDGKYLFDIYKKGKGSQQYKYMEYVTYDYLKKEVLVVDTRKYIWYDLKGNYLRSYESPYNFSDHIALLENSNLAYYRDFGNADRSTNPADLNILDSTGNLISRFLPTTIQKINHRATYMNGQLFSNQRAGAIIVPTYSDKIFELSNTTKLRLKYRIDYGINQLPKGYTSTVLTNTELDFKSVRKFENDNQWATTFHVANADSFICVSSRFQNKIYHTYFSKKTGSTINIEAGKMNKLDGAYFYHTTSYDDYFVSWVKPEVLKEALKNNEVTNPETIAFIRKLDNGNNPVARFVKLKAF